MSRECCEPEEGHKPQPVALTSKQDLTARTESTHRDENGQRPAEDDGHDRSSDDELVPWWRDRHLLLPIASGVLLAVGFWLEWSGSALAATIVQAGSLVAGAATFVPNAVMRLLRRRTNLLQCRVQTMQSHILPDL